MDTTVNIVELTEQVFTVPQVAKIIKCNPRYVRDLIKSGNLKAMRLGEVKVSAFELNDFLKRSAGLDFGDPYNVKPLVFSNQ